VSRAKALVDNETGDRVSASSARHNHDEHLSPSYPTYRDVCPLGCDTHRPKEVSPEVIADMNVLRRLADELDDLADQTDASGRGEGPGLRSDAAHLRRIASDRGNVVTFDLDVLAR
jgi:hypothetical protein